MNPYIFFLDIDGTLAARGEVPEENARAIKEAQNAGHYVFINTGRSYGNITENILQAAPYDGFVCGLGADIRIHGEQIYAKRLSQDLLEKVAEIFLENPIPFSVFEGEDCIYHVGEETFGMPWTPIRSKTDFRDKYPDAKISKFSCSTTDFSLFEPLYDEVTPYIHPMYGEFALKGHSKANAMHMVAEKLGVPMSRCVAVGDSANDAEMLAEAGIAVVMQNGTDEMKQLADMITGNAWEAGVAEAIRKIIKES